jgi:TatD DNase family protein
VSGLVTYKNGQSRQELVAALPLDHLLIETDAPFQTPHPHRGKRNEPAYVRLIADKIAFVRADTTELVVSATGRNAQRLFAWE